MDDDIVVNHAYSILSVHTVGEHRLMRLRNPWGYKEWKGPWRDAGPEWDTIDSQDRDRLLLDHPFRNDGCFFISFSDYLDNF